MFRKCQYCQNVKISNYQTLKETNIDSIYIHVDYIKYVR